MTDKEYQQAKKELLGKSKNRGLDLWEKVFEHYVKRPKLPVFILKKWAGMLPCISMKEKTSGLLKITALK